MITKRQKDIIDLWQAHFPDKFPSKPAPKVYLYAEDRAKFIDIAINEWGEDTDDATAAMVLWRRGKRWKEATYLEMAKFVLNVLEKDFPALFSRKQEKPLLLKIGIDEDLVSWGKEHNYSRKHIKAALKTWVKRKPYQDALKIAKEKGGKCYGLELEEYDFAEYPKSGSKK